MSERKISETAFAMASLRVLSNYENSSEIRLNDDLAELFIPEEKRMELSDNRKTEIIKKSLPPGLYEYVIARTKYFDKVFLEAVSGRIEQIVILGAGFDTRSYRFTGITGKIKIFEVDAKPTQDYKISALKQNKIGINENIVFVSVDFESDNMGDLLLQKGYQKNAKTLFFMEGVSFYITENSVKEILGFVKNNSGEKSLLCFDFQTIQKTDDLIDTGINNENVKFGIFQDDVNNFITKNGFSLIEHYSSIDMEKSFLTLKNGSLFGRIAPMMHILLLSNHV